MAKSTITAKGQTTVPKEVRDHLGLKPGDQIEFVIQPDGSVRVDTLSVDIRSLKGSLRRYVAKPVTVEQMRKAIRDRFRNK
jgi:AbrB family looped-hinge helix DNA binding protein